MTMKIRESLLCVITAAAAAALGVAGCAGGGSGGDGGGGGITEVLSKVGLDRVTGGRGQQVIETRKAGIDYFMLNESDDDELGRTVAIAATNQWPLFDRPELTKYVTMVGLAVANASADPGGNWTFGVLDTPELGAYSGPGGYVMVTRGAIAAMADEAELAGVLAHEISHVVNRDGFNAVKNSKGWEAVMKGASAADRRVEQFNRGAGVLVEKTLTSGWSRDQETAADDGAVRLLIAAGYDPGGLPRFLERLQQREGRGGGGGKLFSTHPGTGDRIARTTRQAGGKTGATNRERFARAAGEAKL
jgi:predicted Zn-dependent protease